MKKVIFLLLIAVLVPCSTSNSFAQRGNTSRTFLDGVSDGMRMGAEMDKNRMEQEKNQMERERLEYQKQLYQLEIERQKLELEKRKLELELQKNKAGESRELTYNEKYSLENRYKRENGKTLDIGKKLETIQVYDQGFVLPYECVIDGQDEYVLLIAFEKGKPRPSQFGIVPRERYISVITQDDEAIQRKTAAAFPKIYRQP